MIDRLRTLFRVGLILALLVPLASAASAELAPDASSARESPTVERPSGVQPSDNRPNILWLIAEDMGPELGAYGAEHVRTPHLDSLAARGMRFTHVFTTSPVCSPSRSALNTGMYQFTIGAHNHRSHRPNDPSPYPYPLPDGVHVVSDWLRHGGYFTGNVVDFPEGVSFQGSGKTDWNFSYDGEPFDTDEWTELVDRRPFYGQVNFSLTHRGGHWDRADEMVEEPVDPYVVDVPPYYPDHPVVRESWAQYLNAVTALDGRVGEVLGELRASGAADSTIVVFMADHGRAMPRGKQWPYDSGLRVPFIVYVPPAVEKPAGYRSGSVSDRMISGIDVPATTLALAGVPDPPKMQGEIFLGPNRDEPRRYVFGGRDRGDETVDRVRTVRSRRYRYIRNYFPGRPFFQVNRYKIANYPIIWAMHDLYRKGELTEAQAFYMQPERPQEELYNVIEDPWEIDNLAGEAAERQILREMRRRLVDWVERIDDQGRYPEDPEVYAHYEQRMIENYSSEIDRLCEKWDMDGETMSVCAE